MLPTGPHLPARYLASQARTLGDLFRRRAELSPHKPAIYEKQGGSWRATTWGEFHEHARKVAAGLIAHGVARGERVAILGATRAPWAIYDMGAQLAGAVSFGIYPKQSVEQVRYLLAHSEARVVFVDEAGELETVLAAAATELPRLAAIVPWTEELFNASRERDRRLTSPRMFATDDADDEALAELAAAISPEQAAILIYTSGPTGPPKGAIISHRNILAVLASQEGVLELFEDDLSLSFLPMAHAAERVLAFYGRLNSGLTTAYATSLGFVLDELREVRPTVFGAVPRIFEKAYAKIHSELEKKPASVRRVFARARAAGKRALPYLLAGRPLPLHVRIPYRIADALVFRKLRAAFGGRVRWFMTGAAPIALDILELFWSAGLPIFEAYGMTEATVLTHANRPGAVKLGTVGKVSPAMTHRIAEDGEVLVSGPFVFEGYFKDEAATAAAKQNGWLHTGDIGTIDADGFLTITDRKKHLIITSGGKNLAPANIEKAIKNRSPLISHVHAHGDRRAYVAALIAPSPIETLELGVALGLVTKAELEERTRELIDNPTGRSEALGAAMAKVVVNEAFRSKLREAVATGNRELARVEQVRRFVILERDFSQEHGELTPTMKLKRREIESKFAALFDRVYDEPGFAVEA